MTLLQSYLSFFQEICEGRRAAPRGFALPEGGVEARAAALQEQIAKSGIPAFVKACAAEAGLEIPQAEYDGFDEAAFYSALGQLAQQAQAQQAAPEAAEAAEAREDAAEPEPAKSEIRDIYEVFLDSVSLDDALVQYLIDIARRGDRQEFQTLSHAAARTLLDLDEFLLWLGNKEKLAPPEERACVLVMDACLDRLAREGQRELLAALLSGDETTFRLFRAEAPELVHLPAATYEWYCRNYLDRYYPMRFLMKYNGVVFPEAGPASD
jgi:hypothetical protein